MMCGGSVSHSPLQALRRVVFLTTAAVVSNYITLHQLPVTRSSFFLTTSLISLSFLLPFSKCGMSLSLSSKFYSRSALLLFHRKLKKLKFSLRALNREKYGDIPKKTKEAFDELCACQNTALLAPNPESFAAVSAASLAWRGEVLLAKIKTELDAAW